MCIDNIDTCVFFIFFFFKQKTAYEMRISDWSSDVCSSDLLGVADVVTKSVGTSNPYNMIRATFEALGDQTSPKSVAQRRGKTDSDLITRGGASDPAAEAEDAAVTAYDEGRNEDKDMPGPGDRRVGAGFINNRKSKRGR